jgi:hypothetical protein
MQWRFIIFVLVAWSVLFVLHYVVYVVFARAFSLEIPWWGFILGILSLSYLLASIAVRTVSSIVADWFYFLSATWLGFIFLLFSGIVTYEVVHVVTGHESQLFLGLIAGGVIIAGIYALIAGRELTTQYYSIEFPSLQNSIRFVHLSDIHIGTVHQKKYLQRVVDGTNALNPDFILVTGDLFDGSAPIEEDILEPLHAFTAPSFFSNGNHEEYEGLDKVRRTLSGFPMKQLENESVVVGNVEIIGVDDRQSIKRGTRLRDVLESIPRRSALVRILMYHTPVEWKDAQDAGVDIMVSGHTHNGQIFPFTLLVRLFFKHINGLYSENGKYLHVSPGTGTWGPPMRLGSRNQITLIELVPIQHANQS